MIRQRQHERGTIVVVVLIVASAIAGLAAISAAGILSASRLQSTLEDESVALNDAYARLQHALNVVNNSAYDEANRNIELLDAINGRHGGTAGGEDGPSEPWLQDPEDVLHGRVAGTDVRVYEGRDYVKRLAKIKGREAGDVDPDGLSRSYYVLEAVGRGRDTVRLVSALVRENEPFSAFVFFQNLHTLGVSGAPRGLIHSNDQLAFYFPNGSYVDSVSAVNGFLYEVGATEANTSILSGNAEALPIELAAIDFAALRERANLFVGDPGLDAEIDLLKKGVVKITQYTPPHYEDVEHSWTGDVLVGYQSQTVTEVRQVQVGTVPETRTRQVRVGTKTETYTVDVPVYETQTLQRTRLVPVYENQVVERTRDVPVYETRVVTRTRRVQVFIPFDSQPDSGTAVGGGGGVPGEWVWVDEPYEAEEQVIIGYVKETYTETVRVQTGTFTETYAETVQVQVGTVQEPRTRNVPVYETETYTVDVPVYEKQPVQVEKTVPVYEARTYTWTTREFIKPAKVDATDLTLGEGANTIYIDGRITRLEGDLQGRLTVIGNEKVRVTGSLRYVDADGEAAMLNGDKYKEPYVRNPEYGGRSVLGVIARGDILFTRELPNEAEINGTLLSATGRVGIDGFAIREDGEPTKDWRYGLTPEQVEKEDAYESTSYRTRRFRKESLRRIGGLISNDRILETYIAPGKDGTAVVDSGFKRGVMRYDTNLIFNPPPNFVEVPRPVVTSVAPIYFMRNDE